MSGNLSDGFTGLGDLQLDEDLHYAFDVILTPNSAPPPPPVPEPNYIFLMGIALLAPFFLRKMRAEMSCVAILRFAGPDTNGVQKQIDRLSGETHEE